MIASRVLAVAVYSGRDNQLHVTIPGVDTPAATATVDGVLDEAAWQQAVRLTGFSQYSPVDGRAAEDETEVLVFYSPTTICFGIRRSLLRRQPARDSVRWRAGRGIEQPWRRALQRARERPRGDRPHARLCVSVERAADRRRLRDRNRHPVQDVALSHRPRAVVGAQRRAPRAEQRPGEQLGPGPARQELVPRAVANDRRLQCLPTLPRVHGLPS